MVSVLFFPTDVGAFFEEGMWLRYNFQASGTSAKDSGTRSDISPDQNNSPPDLAHEGIHFSFSTTKAPCILLYVSSFTTDFLAVLIKPTGKDEDASPLLFNVGSIECSRKSRLLLPCPLFPTGPWASHPTSLNPISPQGSQESNLSVECFLAMCYNNVVKACHLLYENHITWIWILDGFICVKIFFVPVK